MKRVKELHEEKIKKKNDIKFLENFNEENYSNLNDHVFSDWRSDFEEGE